QYVVEVNTGEGDGTVELDFIGSDVQDVAGNLLPGGSFAPPIGYQPVLHTASLALGDLNGDGVVDLVVANTGEYVGGQAVSVQLGNGDGTFQSATTYQTRSA